MLITKIIIMKNHLDENKHTSPMAIKKHSDKIKQAMEQYNDEHPDDVIVPKEEKNFVVKLWDKLGKTGQVIALVAGILTGITTIKPYAEDGFKYIGKFISSIEHNEENTSKIKDLEKYNEVTSSILKSILFPYWHENPDGTKVKLYKTRAIDGHTMTYHFVECCIFYAANYNIESGHWYYIDDKGKYFEI